MPSTTQRRSPRAAPRVALRPTPPAARPLQVPFAAVFGLLTAVVDGYLGWVLVTDPQLDWGWYLAPFAALGVLAVLGAVLVWTGRGRGAVVLGLAGALTGTGLVVLLVLFLAVGSAAQAWWVLAQLVAPVGAVALAGQQPVRGWTRRGRRAAR